MKLNADIFAHLAIRPHNFLLVQDRTHIKLNLNWGERGGRCEQNFHFSEFSP